MEAKHKNSKQRSAIYDMLCSTKEHPTAEMIHTALKPLYPSLSLGTVYRNLTLFQEEGMVISVGNVGGQERYDAATEPHPHFMCRLCHRVSDLDIPDTVSCLYREVEQSGGRVEGYNLVFSGVCADCTGQ